jgi:hypothetical protein
LYVPLDADYLRAQRFVGRSIRELVGVERNGRVAPMAVERREFSDRTTSNEASVDFKFG